MKCVMIVDPSLPSGLIADTTAALGLSLGNHINGLIGPDIQDRQANTHPINRTGAGLVDTNHTHRRS